MYVRERERERKRFVCVREKACMSEREKEKKTGN